MGGGTEDVSVGGPRDGQKQPRDDRVGVSRKSVFLREPFLCLQG